MCLKKLGRKVMAVLEHFLFNSDYPADKLVFMKEVSVTIQQTWTPNCAFINTNCPVLLYPEGDYHVGSSTNVYPICGVQFEGNTILTDVWTYMHNGECWIVPNARAFNSSDVGKTVNFRIWAYYGESEAKNTDISLTVNAAKPKLAINSDENYPRFIGDAYVTQGQEYTHSLGVIPYVKAWMHMDESVPLPNGSSAQKELYAPRYYAHFGTPDSDIDTIVEQIYQVSDQKITTFKSSQYPTSLGIYFRIYVL